MRARGVVTGTSGARVRVLHTEWLHTKGRFPRFGVPCHNRRLLQVLRVSDRVESVGSVGEHGTETSGQGGRFDSSETESDRDDCISSHSEQNCPPLRKKRKQSRLSYQQDWNGST